MIKKHSLISLENLELFAGISNGLKSQLRENIQELSLEPGQQINDFDHLPPGIIYIRQGEVRLLGLDQNGQMFTVYRFRSGDIIGGDQLLRGIKGQSFASSTSVRAQLLPVEFFFYLIEQEPKIVQSFSLLGIHELFSVIQSNSESNSLVSKGVLPWLKETAQTSISVKFLLPGTNLLEEHEGSFLVSSCNIEGKSNGSLITGPIELKVSGKLAGRLVPLPDNWPPVCNNDIVPRRIEDEERSDVVEENTINRQLELEALGDWFGTLHDDGVFPYFKGEGVIDEALACMRMLARFFDLPFRRDLYRRVLQDQVDRSESKILGLTQFAAIFDLMGLRASLLTPRTPELLKRAPLPSLSIIDGHPLLLWQQKNNEILLSSPSNGQNWIKYQELFDESKEKIFSLLYLEKNANAPKSRFGLSWFLPAIKKHRSTLFQVVIASFFVQLLGLFNPLLIQQIIDAVISQGNLKSLNVLGILLLAMALAQALLGALRTYLFADTTNRIDIALGASIIHHLFRLPLGYFSRRPVGEVSSRISELENIRSFLTGTALTVFLDATFSVIYIAVMLIYSVPLTFWALAVVPLFMGLTIGVAPIVRKQLRERAEANARVQSHLVETLSGMETVKGQGMELPSEWRWEQFYGRQIQVGFQNTITSTAASSTNQFLQQLSGLLIIWMGAMLVLQGKMTLGQLIAFRILSGYVTSPLLRLATLWQNFQETGLSLERLSDIVDHQEEIEIAGENLPPMPPVNGLIAYRNVNFRFGSRGPLQLLNITFEIPAGSFVGIVGTSGSGKSTLLKLLTRLFDPIDGSISIDGLDISKFDLYSLRRQIGVVPQDSLLFDGSVQENIALARPESSFDEITQAAKIACAHDFIQSLPSGYSSSVGERGSGLSGGQRQRIAIARTILKKPRLLILDEATSALDLDTEKKLINNLGHSYKDITVLFITHRLTSLRNSDQILLMHEGVLSERGTHEELMASSGRYATLYQQQGLNER